MTEKNFINELAKRTGMSEYAINEICNVSSELIAETLVHGENVRIPKIGIFEINSKLTKNLIGVKNNEAVCAYLKFKINDKLKTRVKDGQKYQKMT